MAAPAFAADGAATHDKHLMPAMLWSLLPGGGFFYLGDPATGATYAALTGTFLVAGAQVERRNDELGRHDEVNVPWLVGDKIWEYSVFSTFREASVRTGADLRAAGFDDTPTASLWLAPFDPDQFLRPQVFGAALLGVAGAAWSAHDRRGGKLRDVTRAHMLGNEYNRDGATALYGACALGVSLGAGVSEEAVFRGMLQTVFQQEWGEERGLWAASSVFGAAHLIGLDGRFDGENALFATGAGAYLGWLYNHDDNRLSGPIAAHFWYDFAVLATTWALEPENTPFGFDVEFRF